MVVFEVLELIEPSDLSKTKSHELFSDFETAEDYLWDHYDKIGQRQFYKADPLHRYVRHQSDDGTYRWGSYLIKTRSVKTHI